MIAGSIWEIAREWNSACLPTCRVARFLRYRTQRAKNNECDNQVPASRYKIPNESSALLPH
jgi:hypothetical protein